MSISKYLPTIGSKGITTLAAEGPHEVHRAMQRAGVLHRDERVALEHEARHAHEHREEVVIERFRLRAEEARPDLFARAEAERASCIDARRHDRLDELAFVEADDTAPV